MSNDINYNDEPLVIEHTDVILKPSKKIRQDILSTDVVDEKKEDKDDKDEENDKDKDKDEKKN